MHDPMDVFMEAWRKAKAGDTSDHRNAVCVSTVDADGCPNARFVDLKAVDARGFVFCTSLESAKALELRRNAKAAMTMWWAHVAAQIRIRGVCEPISAQEAQAHWASRSWNARLVTVAFAQSRPLADLDTLADDCARAADRYRGEEIPRPEHWGGFRLRPDHVEFLDFSEDRLHRRTAYSRDGEQWRKHFLQP